MKAKCDGGTCGLGGYCEGCPMKGFSWQRSHAELARLQQAGPAQVWSSSDEATFLKIMKYGAEYDEIQARGEIQK